MPQSTLEICQNIAELDRERMALERELMALTGKTYEEFVEGMRRLFEPIEKEEAEWVQRHLLVHEKEES